MEEEMIPKKKGFKRKRLHHKIESTDKYRHTQNGLDTEITADTKDKEHTQPITRAQQQ